MQILKVKRKMDKAGCKCYSVKAEEKRRNNNNRHSNKSTMYLINDCNFMCKKNWVNF